MAERFHPSQVAVDPVALGIMDSLPVEAASPPQDRVEEQIRQTREQVSRLAGESDALRQVVASALSGRQEHHQASSPAVNATPQQMGEYTWQDYMQRLQGRDTPANGEGKAEGTPITAEQAARMTQDAISSTVAQIGQRQQDVQRLMADFTANHKDLHSYAGLAGRMFSSISTANPNLPLEQVYSHVIGEVRGMVQNGLLTPPAPQRGQSGPYGAMPNVPGAGQQWAGPVTPTEEGTVVYGDDFLRKELKDWTEERRNLQATRKAAGR